MPRCGETLGIAVFSGMLGVTLFGIFLTPVFYYVIQWASDARAERRQRAAVVEESEQDSRRITRQRTVAIPKRTSTTGSLISMETETSTATEMPELIGPRRTTTISSPLRPRFRSDRATHHFEICRTDLSAYH